MTDIEICVELVSDPEDPTRVMEPEAFAVPAVTETVTCWDEPAVREKGLGEIVAPGGRLFTATEIVPVKP
jgi:hypothetical protein